MSDRRQPRVLCVEDNPINQALLEALLVPWVPELTFTTNVTDGWTHAASMSPDVVVLDFYLPDGTGLDLLERIRGHAHTEHIPVIITTADFELEGAFFKGDPLTTFVHKPIDQTAFALAIDAALGFAEFVPPTPRPAS